MKYMIILFGDESTFENMSEEEMGTMMQAHADYDAWMQENGIEVLGGEELQPSQTGFTVRRDGSEVDGPFLEIKEQLGGYYVIEADSLELAKEAARRAPNYGATELRPVMVYDAE